jgi:hypothetical protein
MIMGRGVLGLWGGRCIEARVSDGDALFDMYPCIEHGSGTVGLWDSEEGARADNYRCWRSRFRSLLDGAPHRSRKLLAPCSRASSLMSICISACISILSFEYASQMHTNVLIKLSQDMPLRIGS